MGAREPGSSLDFCFVVKPIRLVSRSQSRVKFISKFKLNLRVPFQRPSRSFQISEPSLILILSNGRFRITSDSIIASPKLQEPQGSSHISQLLSYQSQLASLSTRSQIVTMHPLKGLTLANPARRAAAEEWALWPWKRAPRSCVVGMFHYPVMFANRHAQNVTLLRRK